MGRDYKYNKELEIKYHKIWMLINTLFENACVSENNLEKRTKSNVKYYFYGIPLFCFLSTMLNFISMVLIK